MGFARGIKTSRPRRRPERRPGRPAHPGKSRFPIALSSLRDRRSRVAPVARDHEPSNRRQSSDTQRTRSRPALSEAERIWVRSRRFPRLGNLPSRRSSREPSSAGPHGPARGDVGASLGGVVAPPGDRDGDRCLDETNPRFRGPIATRRLALACPRLRGHAPDPRARNEPNGGLGKLRRGSLARGGPAKRTQRRPGPSGRGNRAIPGPKSVRKTCAKRTQHWPGLQPAVWRSGGLGGGWPCQGGGRRV